jgi:hypothetical protein
MENFDIKKYLIENQLTTNSQQLEENVIKNLVAAALMNLGVVGGVKGQEAPKIVQDTNPITWQQMTQAQKAAVKKALVDKGGYQLFQTYKDSVSTDATNRREADFAKGAAIKGMTVDQYRKYLAKNAKRPDVPLDGLEVGRCNTRGKDKGSCSTKQTYRGDSLRDVN